MNPDYIQAALNYYPDQSPFWDSPGGQDVLEQAHAQGFKATNTNRDRWDYIYEARENGDESEGFDAMVGNLERVA